MAHQATGAPGEGAARSAPAPLVAVETNGSISPSNSTVRSVDTVDRVRNVAPV